MKNIGSQYKMPERLNIIIDIKQMCHCAREATNLDDEYSRGMNCAFDFVIGSINDEEAKQEREETKEYKKPPLGIMPRRFHDDERKCAILQAMERYSMAEFVIPIEWIRELAELCTR